MTIYEKNLEAATIAFNFLVGSAMSNTELLEVFFPLKVAEHVKSCSFPKGKHAIVLLGQSCIGKTTFARDLIKSHPDYKDYKLISHDECTDYTKHSLTEIESSGNDVFGKLLEEGEHIIIEGGWIYLAARSALLKTLYELGYSTTLFLFFIDFEEHKERIRHRAMEFMVPFYMPMKPSELLQSPLIKLSRKLHLTIDETEKLVSGHPLFEPTFNQHFNTCMEELENSNFVAQISGGQIAFGADEILFIKI